MLKNLISEYNNINEIQFSERELSVYELDFKKNSSPPSSQKHVLPKFEAKAVALSPKIEAKPK